MIHGLTEYEKYQVIRPLWGQHKLDRFYFPIIHKPEEYSDSVKFCSSCGALLEGIEGDNANYEVETINPMTAPKPVYLSE